MEPPRIGAGHDDEIGIGAGGDRRLHLLDHELGRDQVLDADVMLDAAGKQLVLDLDRGEAGGFGQRDGALDMHGVAPAAAGIEHDGQLAGGAHVDRHLRHFGQRDVGFGHAFVPAERAAAHVDRLEAGFLGQPRHDRIERDRRDDELIAANELTQCLQWLLLYILMSCTPEVGKRRAPRVFVQRRE